MKAEERHELKENELKNWLQYGFPIWIKQNGSYVLLAGALVLLGYQLWNWYEKKQEARSQAAWTELLATQFPGVEGRAMKIQAIIDQYEAKPVRALALRDLGNAYLDSIATGTSDEASSAIPLDKQDALARAQAAFEHILSEYPDQTLAVGAAKLGLAVVSEDRGDWDAAKKQYEALTDKSSPFAGTAFALQAAVKLAALDKVKSAPRLAALSAASAPATVTGPHTSPVSAVPSIPSPFPLHPEATVTLSPQAATSPAATLPTSAGTGATQPR